MTDKQLLKKLTTHDLGDINIEKLNEVYANLNNSLEKLDREINRSLAVNCLARMAVANGTQTIKAIVALGRQPNEEI